MKVTAAAVLSAAVAVSAAQPHHHAHHAHLHHGKRADMTTDVVVVPGPTVMAYVLNGHAISEEEVQQGIKNGSLVYAQGGGIAEVSSEPAVQNKAPATIVIPSSSSEWVAPTSSAVPTTSSEAPPPPPPTTSSAAPVHSAPPKQAAWSHPGPSHGPPSNGGGWSSSGSGVDSDFPDGQLDCSHFPSDYGAVDVEWLGLGGWTGVQAPNSYSGGMSDIMTMTKAICSGSNCCTEGSYCSYACPAGYQKSQWPTEQGATGQSIGGIQCKNGKLHLTNPSMSKSLCMTGAEQVTVLVKNEMSENVAVCRTDYPGTEGETVPLNAQAGQTEKLTCPDADNYYNWEGGHTSAQYYVNPAGVSVQDACQWGSNANPWGNFAPLNLGVGYSNGAAWLSIFQNAPTTSEMLDFSVEIQGDGMSGTCRYSNGQYCGGANYNDCSSTTGCTVSISSGTATFVFSN